MKKTRVSIVLTIALVICLNLAGLKNPIHYLTNEFLVEMFQVTNVNPMVGNSDIVIVNISDSSEEMIKDLIEVLSYYDPSVIAVDYFSADTANHAEADIPYRNLVLPALLENGSIVHSRNPFTKNASYGSIAVFSSLYFQPFVDYKDAKVPFMAVKIVELHDSIHYKRIAGLGTQKG